MPKISTHLHLALKILEKLDIQNETAFLLGNAYRDCWYKDEEAAVKNHYKSRPQSACDLKRFLKENTLDDFNLGWYFHLWTDNRFKILDTGDISGYDRVICDMPVVHPLLQKLQQMEFSGREKQAVENIRNMANQPVPLYMVDRDKSARYEAILENVSAQFVSLYVFFTT